MKTESAQGWTPRFYLATPEGLRGSDGVLIPYLFQASKKFYCVSDSDMAYLLGIITNMKALQDSQEN